MAGLDLVTPMPSSPSVTSVGLPGWIVTESIFLIFPSLLIGRPVRFRAPM